MTEIKFDQNNYRKHSNVNKKRIAKSLKECGAGRSVLVDKDGVLIAGNGVYEQAQKLGIAVREVETDGTELVVVKRTDIGENDKKRKELAMADNATSDNIDWEFERLLEEFSIDQLKEWGINIKETMLISNIDYETIYYEPEKRPMLKLSDCVDLTKFEKKVQAINESNLPKDIKQQLMYFTYRFIQIDFESVANYYAFNATDEEKQVMERLRLVLVDNGVNGFIEDDLLRITQIMNNE